MKKITLVYGLILGTILTVNMYYMVNLCYNNPGFESNDFLGYVFLVVVFSLVFFGTRNYRNKQSGGFITFGKALKTGTLIAFIGSLMYVVTWLYYYYLFVPDFIDHYIVHVLLDAERNGATPAELATIAKDMAEFKEMYKNPVFVIVTTFAEVFPIGLVVALISAAILRKKPNAEQAITT